MGMAMGIEVMGIEVMGIEVMGIEVMGIEVKNIDYAYGGLLVLEDINISVLPGKGVAVLGPSGCGKSTLMHVMAGLLRAKSGSLRFEDSDRMNKPGWISYMQQDDLLLPWKTVEQNIALPLRLKGVRGKEAVALVGKNLEEFGLRGFGKSYPSQLSGGMRQRAAFMRTCMLRSDFLLLDEPFSKLDYLTRSRIYGWFQEYLKNHNSGFVLVTHDPGEALLFADTIILLSRRPARIIDKFEINQPTPRNRDFLATREAREVMETIIAKAG